MTRALIPWLAAWSMLGTQAPRLQVPTADMPNLVGMTLQAAQGHPVVVRLRLMLVAEPIESTLHKPGTIARQSVQAGSPVRGGSRVTVYVVVGGVEVPAVEGLTLAAARERLARLGFRAEATTSTSTRARPGLVSRQTPSAGTLRPRGSTVQLEIGADQVVPQDPRGGGRGDTPPQPPNTDQPLRYKMPNLVGRLFGEALEDATVKRVGLRLIRQDDRLASARPGTVVRQSVAAGDPITPASVVTLSVATGVVVPAVEGLPTQLARQRIADAGLQSRVNEVVGDGAPGIVVDQTPNSGVVVSRGAAVSLSISVLAKVTVPDVRRRQRGDAANVLTGLRLQATFGADPESNLAPDLVVSQDPPPGVDVVVGTVIRMRVATGVVVPSVVGSSRAEANARIASIGLQTESVDVRTDRGRANTVFEQQPSAGQRVARGTNVRLSVALTPLVAVPGVIGRSQADAEAVIKESRFTSVFENDDESTLNPGQVTRQEPAAGTLAEIGTPVRVAVATGVVVPEVVKLSADVARARIEAAALRVEEQTEVNDQIPESTVLRQTPESNARVARGAVVSVVIAVRRTVVVPDLLGRTQAEVERLLSPSLTPRFETAATAAPNATPGTVVEQTPGAGTIVAAGSLIRVVLFTGAGRDAQPPVQPPPTVVQPPTPVQPVEGWWRRYLSSAIPWVLSLGLVAFMAYRFIKVNRAGVESRTPDVLPPPDLQLKPYIGEVVSRMEVRGPSLIDFDVRIRMATDPGDQKLLCDGPLVGEERRLYE